MASKWYVGIDPGKNGGIAIIDSDGKFVDKATIPKVKDDVDIEMFYNYIMMVKAECEGMGNSMHVCIESVHSIFGSSAGSNFTFGYVVGIIDTIIIANKLPYSKVQPKEWQKNIWQEYEIEREPSKVDKKGKTKPGKVLTKITSLKACKRLYPNVDLRATERSKIQHDGLVDALLIATYCRRMNH